MTKQDLQKKINECGIKMLASAGTGVVTAIGGPLVASDLGKTIPVPATDQYLIGAGMVLCAAYMAYNIGKAIKYTKQKVDI